MKDIKLKILFSVAWTVILCGLGVGSISAQEANFRTVSNGAEVKTRGIIARRGSDYLIMKDMGSPDLYYVELTSSTKVETHRKGMFRGGTEYPESYLLRGLRIEVKGRGGNDGHLVAESIKFDDTDLRTAQALEVRVDPVEFQAKENAANIQSQGERLTAQEENAKKLEGQIEETSAEAKAARAQADRANNRINGLDEYDALKTIVVPFATGKFALGPKGQSIIDGAAAWAKTQDRKGWMVAVVGFADSTGNTAKNKILSEKRANAVIGYLVSKHGMSLTRLVQPFGAGVDQPVAANTTAEGRAANRRVEIRLMVNKGIAEK
jgi:outer membrane protein OmpA-like peptidoglycan-associated protein